MNRYVAILQALWADPHTRIIAIVMVGIFTAFQILPLFFPHLADACAKSEQIFSRVAIVVAYVVGSTTSGPVTPPTPPTPPTV